MSRCDCPGCNLTGCPCSFEPSNCISISGSGNAANPLIAEIVIDPDGDNIASCSPSGLLAVLPTSLKSPPYVVTKRDTNQSVDSTNETNIIFSGVVYDPLSMWDAADPEVVTIPEDGLWGGMFGGRWQANADGGRRFIVYLNAGSEIAAVGEGTNPTASETTRQQAIIIPQPMMAGDRVHVSAYQTSGVTLNVLTQTLQSPQLRLVRFGDA